ncbi:ribosome recycling factor [Candidatus Daviesbacteria bacterium RIFCSPLOWO2_01_FULL_43_38]|uniref:Ribosome-recycling factor n=1 Tax=Candidatus Daviesbacteria bacterium RIFCSPHIGHO2_12_FULL_43_11 TaxID=1797780 RepID=A0A1F5K786_9BACT|nr:MAG: ribosome recycling factor [Candidatus Daviesbacteria bacterium RIFCSPHIGHO2_01_FULL_43_17]OGE36813.1 MAG: ribosome recycling factor [Candidatus Daviesbacteria bacterium RIFCSPHIGHO2_12_FULL_43_11]OGE64037.1 MAG: ribosome recycling factor [Candidatus Daviesbacteria bacterium RIFCSPLOWO2_01_FULL_43_38]
MDPVLTEANQKVEDAIDHLKREFSAIRAGRANPSLIEELPVNAYGSRMKLMEVGTITAPQHSLLTVQVWDAGIVKDVVKAIQESNLGLNPSFEGQVIRLPIPPLTAERREEFIKLAHQKMEQVRIEIRQIRQETREGWQKAQDSGEFGEDEFERRSKLLQDLVDKAGGQIEELGKGKEEELQQV